MHIIMLPTDFSAETLQIRREWTYLFKVLQGKICNLQYSAKLSIRVRRDINSSSDKQKLEELSNKTPTLERNIEGTLLNGKESRMYRKWKIPIGKAILEIESH